jgi:hypothetical protein
MSKDVIKQSSECANLRERVNLIGVAIIVTLVMSVFGAGCAIFQGNEIAKNRSEISSLRADVDRLSGEAKQADVKVNGVSYEGKNDKTALELLKGAHTVETKDFSGMGEFVTSIDGVRVEDGKNFWAFYVGGAMASEGAGTYKTKDGEKIEWRLENIQ